MRTWRHTWQVCNADDNWWRCVNYATCRHQAGSEDALDSLLASWTQIALRAIPWGSRSSGLQRYRSGQQVDLVFSCHRVSCMIQTAHHTAICQKCWFLQGLASFCGFVAVFHTLAAMHNTLHFTSCQCSEVRDVCGQSLWKSFVSFACMLAWMKCLAVCMCMYAWSRAHMSLISTAAYARASLACDCIVSLMTEDTKWKRICLFGGHTSR